MTNFQHKTSGSRYEIVIETRDPRLFELIRDAAQHTQDVEALSQSKTDLVMSFVKYMEGEKR